MTTLQDEPKPSPIEVWLSKKNIEITCMVVFEDESTDSLDVDSLSMRGAQREITGWLVGQGYKPVGRWEASEEPFLGTAAMLASGAGPTETVRRFKLASESVLDQVRAIVSDPSTPSASSTR